MSHKAHGAILIGSLATTSDTVHRGETTVQLKMKLRLSLPFEICAVSSTIGLSVDFFSLYIDHVQWTQIHLKWFLSSQAENWERAMPDHAISADALQQRYLWFFRFSFNSNYTCSRYGFVCLFRLLLLLHLHLLSWYFSSISCLILRPEHFILCDLCLL